ncbi:SDR family NAD(P)-dependent oxidoreductase [Shinella sp.]|uniref:SDR family NAD(P)-dependent oxidoreductase n=1 Tax=Shinella sp. TaxID=1870904 RepID=UPI00289756B0|nr:SDR family oxidoreductase [Shinella sp.]
MNAVVLVTGGAAGIGRAIADAVIAGGARAILWDVDAQRLEKARNALGDRVRVECVDVSDAAAVDEAIARIGDDWAPTHLVNNAGIIGRRMPLIDIDPAEVDRVLGINVRSAFVVTRAFLRARAEHPDAAIVNLSSIAASNGGAAGNAVYAASKGALQSLTFAMARELAPAIRVNALAPGIIDTDIQKDVFADRAEMDARAATIPLHRLGDAADVAEAAAWLLFRAAYTTGEVVTVSGGRK